jgi:YebC/PmpR family DNA-binding regulatory protein
MSGHSKWHSIKHKKGAADAKRGKIFTKHAKLITIAAREGGGDIESNPALRTAIENAKTDNVPNSNIERAIKRGTGELKEGAEISEVMYEAYGPEGIALYIQAVTDNKNRTVANIKSILSKHGGNMGTSGSVAYLFEQKGLIIISAESEKHEEIELTAIDAGASDVKSEKDYVEIYTDPKQLNEVKEKFEEEGYKIESSNITFIPENEVEINDKKTAEKVLKLMEALEDDEDVTNVYSNFDIPEEIMKKFEEE